MSKQLSKPAMRSAAVATPIASWYDDDLTPHEQSQISTNVLEVMSYILASGADPTAWIPFVDSTEVSERLTRALAARLDA